MYLIYEIVPYIFKESFDALPFYHLPPDSDVTPEPGILGQLTEVFTNKRHLTQTGAGHVAEDSPPQLRWKGHSHHGLLIIVIHSMWT
mgnify:FL=1